MQSAEDFLRDYLRSRTKVARDSWSIHDLHEKRFFAPNYTPWNHEKAIAGLESERVVTGTNIEGMVEIVTASESFGMAERTRYRLNRQDDSWRIVSIESACCVCMGSGEERNRTCNICKGKGWSLIGETRAT